MTFDIKEYRKAYYLKNKEQIDAKNNLWAQTHRTNIVKTVQRYVARNKEKVAAYNQAYSTNERGRFRTLCYSASRRGLAMELSFADFCKITSKPCNYCGSFQNYNGIDRIDNNKGYLRQNSTACCKPCNMMKKDMSINDFLAHIQRITNHQRGV